MKPRYIPITIGIVKLLIATIIYLLFDSIVAKAISVLLIIWSTISFKVGLKASEEELDKLVNDPDLDSEESNRIFRKRVLYEDEEYCSNCKSSNFRT